MWGKAAGAMGDVCSGCCAGTSAGKRSQGQAADVKGCACSRGIICVFCIIVDFLSGCDAVLPGRRVGRGECMGRKGGNKIPLPQDYRASSYPSAVSNAKDWQEPCLWGCMVSFQD